MKDPKLWVFFITLSGFFLNPNQATSSTDYVKLCRLFKNNTKVRIPGSCDQYMICNGQTAQILKCDKQLQYDAKTQKCSATVANANQLCDNRCFGSKDGIWKSDPTNCRSYYYCENGKSLAGHCDLPFHFDETKQMCVYTRNSKCIGVNSICELVAEGTKFRNEKDCSKYYECKKNDHQSKNCGKDLYFSVQDDKCITKLSVSCNAHPQVSCMALKKPYVGLKSDGATCRGYFKCANKGIVEDLEPMWYQCPLGTFFSFEHQTCVHPVDAICPYDRCESRGNALVNSGKNNCHNYLVCENNVTVKEVTCSNDYFFDETLQACVQKIIYYKCCDDPKSYLNSTQSY